MFERFTDRARRVVVLAQEEARMLDHNYIGTEHILLGLIHEGDSVAGQALEGLGIDLETVRQQVTEIVGRGQTAPAGHIPFTPRAKKVLELSLREALQLGHNYIGTEHILLGLVREGEGVAAQILQKQGADLNRVRQHVISQLSGSAPGREPGRRRRLFGRTRGAHRFESAPVMEAEELAPDLALERLTDDALRAVLAAREEVRRLRQLALEPEHLLVGLLALEDDPAAQRLNAAGATLDAVRRELEAAAQPCEDPLPPVPLMAMSVWQAFARADQRAGEDAVGTGALLDALITSSSSVRLALRAAGADLDALRGPPAEGVG